MNLCHNDDEELNYIPYVQVPKGMILEPMENSEPVFQTAIKNTVLDVEKSIAESSNAHFIPKIEENSIIDNDYKVFPFNNQQFFEDEAIIEEDIQVIDIELQSEVIKSMLTMQNPSEFTFFYSKFDFWHFLEPEQWKLS